MGHTTQISIKTQSRDPVPLVIGGSGIVPGGVESFDETAAKARELVGMMKS
jgi:2,3-bisphosphoglycerate-independent phosphoglycerate mutase